MQRKSLVIAAIAGLMALSACGGGTTAGTTTTTGGDTASSSAPATVTDVTLTVWAPQEDQVDDSSWLPVEEAAFAKAHPEYNITWKNSIVSEGDAGTSVKTDPSAAADVYLFANDQLGTLVDASAVGVLSPDVAEAVKASTSEVMVNSVTGTDGQIYGVPFTANTWFLYYDKSKVTDEDAKSLDTLLTKGKVAFPLSNGWYIASFYAGAGGTLFGPNGNDESAGIDFSGDKATAVTKYLVNLAKNKNFINDDNGQGLAGIGKDVVAFFSGSWDAENVKKALGDNYGAAQPPTFDLDGTATQMKAFAGSKAVAYNPNSKNPEAAVAFAGFLGSADAQKAHFELRGVIPADNSLASDAAVAADPVAKAQMDTIQNASILQPTVSKMSVFWDPAKAFGEAIISGDVTADNAAAKTEAWNKSFK
ncbi:MAG: extracellular solute-binding protein [Propionibacteriaceae bacterium]|jgi:arabinogalactan oligomer/maltooligosaccharide transport system substrate-binding protein|nr:extracellular solute-binding protein [Propionibacteriaceae bacterium]